ncbi:MAG: GrpB family protein [Steroidobacteraceae bacterium]
MAHRLPVVISEYSTDWAASFQAERIAILDAVGSDGFEVEHIGSTAVAGLAAKPIIDIMIGASDMARIEGVITRLESIGYEYMPNPRIVIPNWRFFAKPITRPRLFHLHGVVLGGSKWSDLLLFREALRSDPLLAREYAALKLALASRHHDDRSAYTDEKADFIQSVLERSRSERGIASHARREP